MKLIIEETKSAKQKILIVDKRQTPLFQLLKKELEKYDNNIFISPKILPNFESFPVCIFIDEPTSVLKKALSTVLSTKCIFIYVNKPKIAEDYAKHVERSLNPVKLIHIESEKGIDASTIEKIIWFCFSQTQEKTLLLYSLMPTELEEEKLPTVPTKLPSKKQPKKLTRGRVISAFLIFVFVFHFLYIPPLLASLFFFYKAEVSLKQRNINKMTQYENTAKRFSDIGKKLFALVRPTYLIFSVSNYPDSLFELSDTLYVTLNKTATLYDHANTFSSLFLKKDKSPVEVARIVDIKEKMSTDIDILDQYIVELVQKLPDWPQLDKPKQELKDAAAGIETAQKLFPYFDSIFAKGTTKKYLVLFANNMELRPGGGFIGSFAVVTLNNYTLKDIKVYDVYDADGQLKEHIDPPNPIRLYLQQPNWFLRDSAFSPNFPENYQQAKTFLSKEMKFTDFDGGMLITTTTIQNILQATGDIYIPEFKEHVNRDNFYIKAQLYAEKDFFPGSTQKKRFLSAVADQLFINLEDAPQIKLAQMLQKSLEEKQMVMYFEDQNIQNQLNDLYWSGEVLTPTCPGSNPNCITNYLFPIEANLGVNKANFFTKKYISLNTKIDEDGMAHNNLQVTILNNSENDIFPGGTYKNYFQFMLPNASQINTVTKDNNPVTNYDITDSENKTLGLLTETLPQSATKITITYDITKQLQKGKGLYQLIIQKQIGSGNSEFQLSISLPSNVHIVSQNFSPLVKNNEIVYNTTLTADKIFFIELFKE
jgi:hypothetical protein